MVEKCPRSRRPHRATSIAAGAAVRVALAPAAATAVRRTATPSACAMRCGRPCPARCPIPYLPRSGLCACAERMRCTRMTTTSEDVNETIARAAWPNGKSSTPSLLSSENLVEIFLIGPQRIRHRLRDRLVHLFAHGRLVQFVSLLRHGSRSAHLGGPRQPASGPASWRSPICQHRQRGRQSFRNTKSGRTVQ